MLIQFLMNTRLWVLAVLSGLLMALSFPAIGGLNLLMSIAFVPLLIAETRLAGSKRQGVKVFLLGYLTFFIFNTHTSYWIVFADPVGGTLAFLANTLLMAAVFWLFFFTKKYVGEKQGYIGLVFYWLAFEYLHYNWEISHPWLTLGNVFANFPQIVQWYEWTGVLGGSLWILLLNLLIFGLILVIQQGDLKRKKAFIQISLFVFLVPALWSIFRYSTYKEIENPIEVVVTQPNLDPYTEKFGPQGLGFKQQMDSIFLPAQKVITETTDFILAPETAIGFEFLEDDFKIGHPYFDYITQEMEKYPQADLLIGASSAKIFKSKNSPSAREYSTGQFVESYNTSVFMPQNEQAQFIHKSKLVLGVEKIPFNRVFPWLEELSIDLGGSTGSLGIESKPKIFNSDRAKFASLVCYESIYGDWTAGFIREGAEAIFIITNDGWWKDTPGYKQHFQFARLRAIEFRRSVARSANTGTSGFINQRGDILKSSEYNIQTALNENINLNKNLTPYAIHGDIIGRISWLAAILILILAAAKFLKNLGQKNS